MRFCHVFSFRQNSTINFCLLIFFLISSRKIIAIYTWYQSYRRLYINLVLDLLLEKFLFAEFLVQIFFSARKMPFNGLRLEYALEGTSYFLFLEIQDGSCLG